VKCPHPILYTAALPTTGTYYWGPGQNQITTNTTEGETFAVIPYACTVRNLYAIYGTGGPGAGTSVTFTIRKYTAAAWGDGITCTISNTGTTGNSGANTTTFAAGDLIALQTSVSGSPTSRAASVGIEIEADDATFQILLGCTLGAARGSTASTYYMTMQGGGDPSTSESTWQQAVPAAGSFSRLYIAPDQSIGGGAKSYTTTFRLNGADDTAVQVVSTTTTGLTAESDATGSVAVSRGDLVCWSNVPSGTPTAVRFGWGCVFVPTTAGDSILMSRPDPSTGGARYHLPIKSTYRSDAEEEVFGMISSDGDLRDLYVIGDNPNPGTYTLTARLNGSSQTLTATVSSGSAVEDTTHTVTYAPGNRMTWRSAPASSPAGGAYRTSAVFRVAAAAGGSGPGRILKGGLIRGGLLRGGRLVG